MKAKSLIELSKNFKNSVSSEISEGFLSDLSSEEIAMLADFILNIEFIQNLCSPNRKYARDLKRYENPNEEDESKLIEDKVNGRIIVDITNPHIIEDCDFFRQAAIHFETHGVYSFLKPSANPLSPFRTHWDEEIRRCREGLVRQSDGEWIPGYFYFYLNYAPIMRSVKRKGSKRSDRVQGLPDFYDGDYFYFHYLEKARDRGKHVVTLKKRGAGFSLKAAGKMGRNFIMGESKEASINVRTLAIANEKEYLTKDGVLNKFVDVIDFCAKHTPFASLRLKQSWADMTWTMGYVEPISGITKGSGNEVIGVTLKNDPEKARGKRASLIIWEEFGKFTNSLKAWTIGLPSVQEEGGYVFGQMAAFGTGGTEGADFTGLREMFYNPGGYFVEGMKNVFDKKAKNARNCGFFYGSYLAMKGKMDKDGNSDVIAALKTIVQERVFLKYNSKEASTITQGIAEKAITPQESIMKTSGNYFDTHEAKEYLEECRVNESSFTSEHISGKLVQESNGRVTIVADRELIPIRTYNSDKENLLGAVEIFAMPEIDHSTSKPFWYRYILGADPVDSDYLKNGSLASVFVFDLWNDEIVAEYTGRPQLAEDFYEICRKLCIMYNGVLNYENNLKGMFSYFNIKNNLHLLADTPSHLRDVEQTKEALIGNRSKGTRTTRFIIEEGKRLQRSWHRSSYTYIDGNGEEVIVLQMRRIRSLGYLEEIIEYNPDGNFDRISAMDMVMILRQERLSNGVIKDEKGENVYIEQDEFIKENYSDDYEDDIFDNFDGNYITIK